MEGEYSKFSFLKFFLQAYAMLSRQVKVVLHSGQGPSSLFSQHSEQGRVSTPLRSPSLKGGGGLLTLRTHQSRCLESEFYIALLLDVYIMDYTYQFH